MTKAAQSARARDAASRAWARRARQLEADRVASLERSAIAAGRAALIRGESADRVLAALVNASAGR